MPVEERLKAMHVASWGRHPTWDSWGLFERFTERARQVVVLAQEEARALRHAHVGTEHLLLGLLREEEGLAARVLEALDITLERARAEVVRIVGSTGEAIEENQMVPFTPRAKKVLELALREGLSLGHNHIGTEHILLGLVHEGEGVAFRILLDFGVDAEGLRGEVIRMLSGPGARQRAERAPGELRGPGQPIAPGWLDGLRPMLDSLADEIRRELGREPDSGDPLLVLATAPATLAAQALQQCAVDLDALWGQIERLRRQRSEAQGRLAQRIETARVEKEQAIEAQQFEIAARLRDEERELTEQQRAGAISPGALQAIRRRLGLPTPPDPPTTIDS